VRHFGQPLVDDVDQAVGIGNTEADDDYIRVGIRQRPATVYKSQSKYDAIVLITILLFYRVAR